MKVYDFKLKLIVCVVAISVALLPTPLIVSAQPSHSGGTDSSGCHTCRTNCPKYGLYYGQYHCHNPKSATRIPTSPSNSYCVSAFTNVLSYNDVRVIQAALTIYGYPPGPIDGYLGPRTQLAINVYEFAQGLSISSNGIRKLTLMKLGILC